MRIVGVLVIYRQGFFLPAVIEGLYGKIPLALFLSKEPWRCLSQPVSGDDGTLGWLDRARKLRVFEHEIVRVWNNSTDEITWASYWAREQGYDFIFIIGGDEIWDPDAVDDLLAFVEFNEDKAIFSAHLDTYWKDIYHKIHHPTHGPPEVVVRAGLEFKFDRIPQGGAERALYDGWRFQHPSYVRTDEEVLFKAKHSQSIHSTNYIRWFWNVWKAWDVNPNLRNLHPTHPPVYERAVFSHETPLSRLLDSFTGEFEFGWTHYKDYLSEDTIRRSCIV